MQTVSQQFLQEQKKAFTGAAALRVELTVADLEAVAEARPQGSAEMPWSSAVSALAEEGAQGPGMATFEPGRLRADGAFCIPGSRVGTEGWVSREMSGEDGRFARPPQLDLVFSPQLPASMPAMNLAFDRLAGEWCSELVFSAWRGNKLLLQRTLRPTGTQFQLEEPVKEFDWLRLQFLATSVPFRRARLSQLMLGCHLVFGEGEITEASRRAAVDPIGRRLPKGSLRWKAFNLPGVGGVEKRYDPDDPTSLWQFTERRSPVSLQLGQQLTGEPGGWEWLPGGKYYLNGRPKAGGLTVEFEATDTLGLLDRPFYKGRWDGSPHSLYELAEEVLEDSDLPRLLQGKRPWILDESLKTQFTTAPLPIRPGRELLQLLAHAACCVLFCDREGRVCIQSAPQDPAGLTLARRDQLGEGALVEKNPALAQLVCPACQYQPGASAQTLYQASHSVKGSLSLHLEYRSAANVKLQCEGARVKSAQLYASACDLVLEGQGEARLILTGAPLEMSRSFVAVPGGAPMGRGQTETLENPLITQPETARRVALWAAEELGRRSVYRCESRGHLQLDPLDRLTLVTPTSDGLGVRLLESELQFSGGGLAEQLVLKRQQE